MASKRRNMFYQNNKQETTEIVAGVVDFIEPAGAGPMAFKFRKVLIRSAPCGTLQRRREIGAGPFDVLMCRLVKRGRCKSAPASCPTADIGLPHRKAHVAAAGDAGHNYMDCSKTELCIETGRRLSDRFKEHLAAFKLNKLTSYYATHLINSNHEPGPPEKTLTLIRKGNKGTRLNVTENLEIYKHSRNNRVLNDCINSEANILFKQILTGKRKRESDDEGSQVQQNKRNKGHRKRNANEVGNMALPDPKRVKEEGNIKRYLYPIESVVL
ncbi:hypothetical protein AAG570_006527 [Ranatra chinensis]|uniref:Uncharacterized protein n=1 Tax=Ranatra chinensis TaxID=642074 RepID=A0ABD0ZHH1_9HEMI